MITENYVSLETAKLLREKGFDCETDKYYSPEGRELTCLDDRDAEELGYVKRPTLQMAMKWLREVHNIHISVYPFNRELPITENTSYTCDVATKKDSPMRGHLRGTWKTYEKAAEAAIEYCLEHLI